MWSFEVGKPRDDSAGPPPVWATPIMRLTLSRAGPNLSARYHYPPTRRTSVEDFWVAKAVIPSSPKCSNPKKTKVSSESIRFFF